MTTAKFLDIHPVLPVTNMPVSIHFYTEKLGFHLLSLTPEDENMNVLYPPHPSYAVIGRDRIQLHLQSHRPDDASDQTEPLHIRFVIDDVDDLYAEYQLTSAINAEASSGMPLMDTQWGTREFALYDPDRNGLFFYRSRK